MITAHRLVSRITRSMSSASGLLSGIFCRTRCEKVRMPVRGLFNSWATPEASSPTEASFSPRIVSACARRSSCVRFSTFCSSVCPQSRSSRAQLRDWAYTLEQKVEKRTQELRCAQAETVRGEKLASVGLLASGVAHELNNPLTGILTFSHLVRQKMQDKSPDAEDMELVIRETKRCAVIIKRLLDFAREKLPEKKFTDLNQVIDDTVRIVEQPAHLRDIEITVDLDRTLPPIWIDADQIKQVIMNMVVNAQHAVEEKGSIAISTRRSPDPRAPATEPKPMVAISIVDTGCGIPETNLRRIFDPFFTSKDVGKGTGLGLSVSHGIVEAHGGLIEVESKVGEGSTFRVLLPLTPPPAGPQSKASGSVA